MDQNGDTQGAVSLSNMF